MNYEGRHSSSYMESLPDWTMLAESYGHVGINVETKDQLELLQSMGCDLGQGFWYARPMPAEELPLFWQSKQELAEL